jgi:hypothetical protein
MMLFRPFFSCVILLMILGLSPLAAQEEWEDEPGEGEVPIEEDWTGFVPSLYSLGDQTFNISLGIAVPSFFVSDGNYLARNMTLGGTGALSYDFYLGAHLFAGFEVQGMFAGTTGKHMIYMIPINLRIGYQFVIKRFEVPLSLGLGLVPQKFLGFDNLSFFMKPRAAVFFRFNPDWSFGLNTAWWWVPQSSKDPPNTVHGHFFEATLAARYHF